MRSLLVISLFIFPFSALATPLSFDIRSTYQRRGLNIFSDGPKKTAASSPQPASLDDFEAPLLSGSRETFPAQVLKPPNLKPTWIQRIKNELQIESLYGRVFWAEMKKAFAQVRQGVGSNALITVDEFLDKASAENKAMWDADWAALAARADKFQRYREKKTTDFEKVQEFKAQMMQGNNEIEARLEAEQFHAARETEWATFAKEQADRFEKARERYRVVQQTIDKERGTPVPQGPGTNQNSASAAPADPQPQAKAQRL